MSDFFPLLHWTNLLIIPGLLIGYTIHELGHAFTAYYFGDHSQVESGKVTLNPLRHICWFGTVAFLLFGIGWPNPVQINSQHFRERPLAMAAVAFAGPFASFTFGLAALLFTLLMAAMLVYNSGASTDRIFQLLFPGTTQLPAQFDLQALTLAFTSKIFVASLWIALVSSLPLPGLDGFLVLLGLYRFQKNRANHPQPVQQARPVADEKQATPINQYERRNNISDIHFSAGADYHQRHKYDDAIARYRQAIANDKYFGPAYVNLGLAYLGKGKRREAIHAFRGAVQYADDKKSQQAAWYQLHQLSEVSPIDQNAEESMQELGAAPWTDTQPRPDWFSLGLSSALLLMAGIALYGYLFTGLIRMLDA